jgi:glycosyltransferase involved in cell wall biosynthesis
VGGPPLLVALPCGLSLGGVTTFAVRLVNGLAARGRPAALLLHDEPEGCARLEVEFHPGVRVIRPGIAGFESSPGDLSTFIPHYRDAARRLAAEAGAPVVLAPQMLGDCFGVAAALCVSEPERVRIVGWQHSDIEYDRRVLARYEPILARFVAVSDRIEATLRRRLPGRAADIVNIACGVELPREHVRDGPSAQTGENLPGDASRPLRLIYTGRIEHQQKRILALAHLSDELSRRGIEHRITAVGDGPAAPEFDAAIAARPRVSRLPARPPDEVARLLAGHDAFVLASRFEGLSVSMLEAMAAGCVPILARTESGALQAVEPGRTGEVADVGPDADEPETARALAQAVARFVGRGAERRAAMAAAARERVRERFSIQRHLDAVAALIDAVAAEPARGWPAGRACAFTASAGVPTVSGAHEGSGSVPPDGAARLRALLERLAGRPVVVHGTGQHTLQLAAAFASSPARIVAFTDDDRQRHRRKLWKRPIVAPAEAGRSGATDVVISSWMHQEAIWARRGVYEEQGIRVHRVHM